MHQESVCTVVDGVLQFVIEIDLFAGTNFDAPARPGAEIQFYSPFRDHASMANVARAMFEEVHRSGVRANFHNYLNGPWADPAMMIHHGIDDDAPIAFFIGVPTQVPDRVLEHSISIGGFVCETDRILPAWVEVCNRFDLITVPSNWCRDAFIASGVTVPVMVVPHGLEPEYRPYRTRTREKPMVFYNTFHSKSYHTRKGLHELIRAFLSAFEGRDDVILRLRTNDFPELERCRSIYDFGRLIETDIVKDSVPTADYARIFSEVHCTVHPSRGEGFGLVPFQSIACETPVIAPHATGMADYLDASNSVPLATNGRVEGQGVGNAAGTYFTIDEDDLVAKLQYMATNWELEYDKVRAAAPAFRERYQWSNAVAEFVQLARRLAEVRDPALMKAMLQQEFGN